MSDIRNTICALTVNPAIDKTIYVDDFAVDEVNRPQGSCQIPGSKGVNIARIIAKTDINSVCFGFMGGVNGQWVLDELAADGVINEFVGVDYDVRTNIKLVDLKKSTYTDINFAGDNPSEENICELKKKTRELAKKSSLMAIGGSLPPDCDTMLYYELAMIAKEEGAEVSIDCYNEPLLYALRAKPLVIKPNLYELESTYGEKYNTAEKIIEKAMEIYKSGTENVIVSLGKEGALAVCGGDVFRLYTVDLPVYNTVGAGDALLSGFIYGWHKGFELVNCLKHGISFSQAIVSNRADSVKDIEALTKYVDVARVELLCEKGGAR